MSQYINNRGYVIYKKDIDDSTKTSIITELTVQPYIPKSIGNVPSFPIYRESINKLYLPRFYGIQLFGNISDNRLSKGKNINVSFVGNLREYQEKIVTKYIDYVGTSGGGLLEIDTGMGKTVMAINIISKLKKKTIIIVHKEFLMNQWIERLNEFLPHISIGKIQGKNIDHDHDVVIAMLQSLSMKDYEPSIFEEFGLSIYDEVHHMGAEVFSQALIKVNTNYCLGLSATMNRKDGLTKVFKMFLGDVVHVEKREMKTSLLVKVIDYKNNDEEFNTIKYNFRGDPLYSTMISKLCDFNHRSEFILDVLEKELKENYDQHIIVLAHNRSLLNYLHNGIQHRNFATSGFYVGGMKESELKKSEQNKIILATYSMASEGLDIKTLSTLLMATPKTDIIQAVGRILRINHANPLVIDIVDNHDLFQKQFQKRRTFYKKQNYELIRCNNNNYSKNEWKTISFESKQKPKKCIIEGNL